MSVNNTIPSPHHKQLGHVECGLPPLHIRPSVGNNRLTNRLIVIQNLIENRLILARLIDTINFLQYLLKMLQISTKIPK